MDVASKQIAEISREIEAQIDKLQKLENQRSTLQSTLNSILDPMARLPLELSSDIFVSLCLLQSTSLPRIPDEYMTSPVCYISRSLPCAILNLLRVSHSESWILEGQSQTLASVKLPVDLSWK